MSPDKHFYPDLQTRQLQRQTNIFPGRSLESKVFITNGGPITKTMTMKKTNTKTKTMTNTNTNTNTNTKTKTKHFQQIGLSGEPRINSRTAITTPTT